MQNVPYFRHLNKETIKEISLLMNTKHYVAGSLIVQRGDVLTDIYIIKEGVVEVEVPYNNKLLHFDHLPPGSCFSVFAPFGLDAQQILNFRAKSNCVIETINVRVDKKLRKKEGARKEGQEEPDHDKEGEGQPDDDKDDGDLDGDLIQLAKRDHTLSPIIKRFKLQQDNDMLTPFDFFRYLPPIKRDAAHTRKLKAAMRRTVDGIINFCRAYREGKQELPEALTAITVLEDLRQSQRQKMKMFDKEEVKKQIGQGNEEEQRQEEMNFILQAKDVSKIAAMYEMLCQRQQFTQPEGDASDVEGGAVGDTLPDLSTVASAYRSQRTGNDQAFKFGTGLGSQTLNVGGGQVEGGTELGATKMHLGLTE